MLPTKKPVKIGIIGGSGLDNLEIFTNRQEKFVETPYGKPSDALILGKVGDVECVCLARHGRGHTVMPTNINFRANIHALKAEGCTHLLVTTACGSLREQIHPGDIAVIDQFIDRTTKRAQTFYDGAYSSPRGVCHIPMHTPFCEDTRQLIIESLKEIGLRHHVKGTMITIEGPRFSTKSESLMFRSWGADLINMTTVPEVILAKEAGLCYASIAMTTDYDCWRDSGEMVNVESVLKTFKDNAENGRRLLLNVIPKIAQKDWTEIIQAHNDTAKESVMLPPPGTQSQTV
ncbi:S-methyl-5'-thioadenosine phosphorylase-like [Ptychodera flava]|uniref:S-methyl-5'-thioadenosine phosphorylase-like n=1 Tax=Ptychodera flava TaxID=63121 RepID=UPI00396A6DEA